MFSKLVELLETLLANKDKLIDRRDKSQKGKANQNSYGMMTIREAFPSEREQYGLCQGVGSCLVHLFSRYISTVPELTQILPLIREIQPYCYSNEAFYLSKIKSAFFEPQWNKSKSFLKKVNKLFVQTSEEKRNEQSGPDAALEFRVENPLQFELPVFLADIRRAYDKAMATDDQAMLGISLEAAIPGTRSIDLINEDLMSFSKDPADDTVILVSGHSKVRTEAQWKALKAEKAKKIKILALNADEVLAGIQKYRAMVAPTIAHVEKANASHLKQFEVGSLKRTQQVNAFVGRKLNADLGVAMKQVFPVQAAQAKAQQPPKGQRKFASHEARAAASMASYELFGRPAGKSLDLYMKTSLNHSNTGSVLNYKGVSFLKDSQGAEPAAPNNEFISKITELINTVRVMEVEIKELQERAIEPEENKKRKIEDEEEAPKKRKVASHRPIGPQYVKMVGEDGKEHEFQKFARLLGMSEEDAKDRVVQGETMLANAGVPITNAALRKLGLGARSVNCHKTNTKADDDCKATDYSKEK